MAEMLLVTNIPDVDADDMEVITFDDFITRVSSPDGIDGYEEIYVDVSSMADSDFGSPEDLYAALQENGVTFINTGKTTPDWFNGELVDVSIGADGDEEKQVEDINAVSKAFDMIEETSEAATGDNIGKVVAFTSPKGGSGKALSVDEPVLAEHGWKPIGDIQVGDKIWTPKGTLTEVTGVYPQGEKELYQLETMAGQKVNCTLDHLWTVFDFDSASWKTLNTKQLLDRGLKVGQGRVDYPKFALPIAKEIPFSEKKLNNLNFFINDGDLNSVPEEYKFSSIEQRWSFIRCLFDKYGHVWQKPDGKPTPSLFTAHKKLVEDIREILYSLGVESRVVPRRESNKAGYSLNICCPVESCNKFFSKEKYKEFKDLVDQYDKDDLRDYDKVNITHIRYMYDGDAVCIKIADKDELFITRDYIVTHNTFTSLASARQYAEDHPNQRVAILDLDVQEPQLGITVHQINRTIQGFYADFKANDKDFETMKKYVAHPEKMPPNLDFYLTPRMEQPIEDSEFWETVMTNLFFNYDMVVLDCGTEYMKVPAIILAIKVADKVILTSTAALSSSITIGQAIKRITGETPNAVYSAEDEIGPKIHLVLTQCYESNIINAISQNMAKEAPIVASFGIITPQINEYIFLREYNLFDNQPDFIEGLREIMKVSS